MHTNTQLVQHAFGTYWPPDELLYLYSIQIYLYIYIYAISRTPGVKALAHTNFAEHGMSFPNQMERVSDTCDHALREARTRATCVCV